MRCQTRTDLEHSHGSCCHKLLRRGSCSSALGSHHASSRPSGPDSPALGDQKSEREHNAAVRPRLLSRVAVPSMATLSASSLPFAESPHFRIPNCGVLVLDLPLGTATTTMRICTKTIPFSFGFRRIVQVSGSLKDELRQRITLEGCLW